ncbi:tRNA (guanosine(46)-N7)-methyltransferase TrmB [Enterobacteriaceae endosymbiont of Plateumaris consimilis]|uniref:tRNA (guanosine(46)-N7)-methyltransferase TrmB n=1 Tax=Enterobacteriaceae endosymbiont of Plateumaris consimilis TaxID=2675794 RepID=UPI001449D622|nr:tRNA (guanosine(46)-N7)-methyltransferase TrmB [Enterobacteriaceae endosymbiont of Plateumaris consimilis]QJC28692.1 tRNA (guanosine(46)-N7)-methyltransferase TrmB [Enterobacteriaceae endosymbiont of Plateumaris consimilis]
MKNNIKSFICRYRKLSKSQKKILEKYSCIFNIEFQTIPINFNLIFHNNLPIIIDIGFGTGELLINIAINNPQYNFIGIEVYIPGIINCLKNIHINKINNLQLINYNAVDVLQKMIPYNFIKLIQIYFPDPWPKLKHKKRRLLNNHFLKQIFLLLQNKGILYINTDDTQYKDYIIFNINNINNNNYITPSNTFKKIYKNYDNLSSTKFFNKAKKINKKIWILEYIKTN